MYRFEIHETVAALCIIFLITGCSGFSQISQKTKTIARTVSFSDGGLKKKIAILPIENQGIGNERLKLIFLKNLGETTERLCPDILLLMPGKPNYPQSLISLVGKSDNMALAEAGKAAGLTAIVRARPGALSLSKEEKGFPMFKSLRNIVSVNAAVEIYDMATGAKLADQNFSRQTETDDTDADLIRAGKESSASVSENAFSDMAAEAAGKVCDVVTAQPWRGYVVSVNKGVLTLSCGKDVGIRSGDLMDVYDRGETLTGAEGQSFFKQGIRIGEVKIIAVFPDRAEAIPYVGKDFREGSSVRQKN